MEAKRRMQQIMGSHDSMERHPSSDSSTNYNFLTKSFAPEESGGDDTDISTGLGPGISLHSTSSTRIKTQDYYAKISAKALSSFASLTESEKNDFFYAFTKNGFKESLRTGRYPDGSLLEPLGNGKYRDRYGLVRDDHGPFWPREYGPLYPAPIHLNFSSPHQEPFSSYGEGKQKTMHLYSPRI